MRFSRPWQLIRKAHPVARARPFGSLVNRISSGCRSALIAGVLIGAGLGVDVMPAQEPTAPAEEPKAAPRIDRQIDWDRETNPILGLLSEELTWPTELRPVWLKALRHPESDLRREVAESILVAHRAGMPGLVELQDGLREVLESSEESWVTRTSVAAALIELDCRDLAPLLAAQAAQGPPHLRRLVERGLADWDYQPIREVWLERISEPGADPQSVRSAVELLAEVNENRAVGPLSQRLLSKLTPPALRIAAARGLAKLAPPEVLEWSERLSERGSKGELLEAQLGVELLAHQSGLAAIELLERYVEHPAPTVAAVALARLLDIEPARVLARAEQMLQNPDANLRRITLSALVDDPTERSVGWLAYALDDRVPSHRVEARRGLLRHAAEPALRDEVIGRSVDALELDSWRSREQALIVLTELQHRVINDRLPALLEYPRDEVQIAAAWAIKHLFQQDRAEQAYELATEITARIDAGGSTEATSYVQAHLLEALGLLEHRPAVELLLKPLPKGAAYVVQSRASAVWALGFLLAPETDAATIRLLEERLADANSVPMEFEEVRAAAAIALGRIGDPRSLAELRRWYVFDGPQTPVGRSCGWSIEQMTGEPLPAAVVPQRTVINWFVEPLAGP
ncbi:MAG: hypothetical protein EA381_11345 [Planctomycetaceae bacterium]|nr:MAG: hypothetical protein EA381_11345 [Planctomycetaceae bacterium]